MREKKVSFCAFLYSCNIAYIKLDLKKIDFSLIKLDYHLSTACIITFLFSPLANFIKWISHILALRYRYLRFNNGYLNKFQKFKSSDAYYSCKPFNELRRLLINFLINIKQTERLAALLWIQNIFKSIKTVFIIYPGVCFFSLSVIFTPCG